MRPKLTFLIVLFLSCGQLFSQDLQVESRTVKSILTTQIVTHSTTVDAQGNILAENESRGEIKPAGEKQTVMIEVVTPASRINVYAEDKDRKPIQVYEIDQKDQIEVHHYTLDQKASGLVWVRVKVIDFEKHIADEKTIVVDIAKDEAEPDPEPDPDDEIDPKPPIDDDIENKYGVGKIAAKFAPDNMQSQILVSQQWSQAAEFLYGRPSLKTVFTENGNDPDNNVFAWLAKEANEMQCPDLETCKQWGVWRSEIAKAINLAQKDRQLTKQDWYSIFMEVSKGVTRGPN